MSSKLPINLSEFLRPHTVEGERIKYMAGQKPDATVRYLENST